MIRIIHTFSIHEFSSFCLGVFGHLPLETIITLEKQTEFYKIDMSIKHAGNVFKKRQLLHRKSLIISLNSFFGPYHIYEGQL